MATAVLNVPDISCEHCERTVVEALRPLDGVRSVAVDIPTKRVTVDYDEARTNIDEFRRTLAAEDYPVAAAV
jgi:copper chaperone CopZ